MTIPLRLLRGHANNQGHHGETDECRYYDHKIKNHPSIFDTRE